MATIVETLNLALQHHEAGRLQEAEALYRQILQVQPDHPDALHLLGVIAHQVGRNEIAIDLLGQAIAVSPGAAEFHNHLAVVYQAQGRREEALVHFRQAMTLQPAFAEASYNLGLMLHKEGRLDEATAHYREALRLKPEYADAWNNLGNVLRTQGKLDEAITQYRQALALKPAYGEAYINLGIAMQEQGRLDEAAAHYREALRLKPKHADALNNLGNILRAQGRLEEAVGYYWQALALEPESSAIHVNLGMALREQGKVEEALAHYRQALALSPTFAPAHISLGDVLNKEGITEEAEACYRRAFATQPSDGLKIKLATMLPAILPSVQDVATIRKRFEENVDALLKEELTLKDPIEEVWQTNFYLAYQGRNDRKLQTKIARLYERACPSLLYTARFCQSQPRPRKAGKIKIGYISRFFKNHSVGKFSCGVLAHLSRERFHVIAFIVPPVVNDDISAFIQQHADATVVLPGTLQAARQRIEQEALDILYYQDIGMDPFTYFLAFSRLAPVQCVTLGHADTSGIRNLDYFISTEYFEPDNADTHYSERLVKLKSQISFYYKPRIPSPLKSRHQLGLDEFEHIYICPQFSFKLHPEFDVILAGILSADLRGRVLLKADRWMGLLLQRFKRTIPHVLDRITIMPSPVGGDFINLIAVSDVMLDPIHFSGFTTSLEAFAVGTPVVTWPGEFQRGRATLGFYKSMEILDCVADCPKRYVELAVRLGTDAKYRAKIRATILARNKRLYEDPRVVKEYERAFLKMAKGQV